MGPRTTTIIVLSVAALALAFAPAPDVASVAEEGCRTLETVEVTDDTTGETTEEDVLACENASYLAGCDDAVGGKFYVQLSSGTVPTELTAPADSFTSGAGCGTPEEPLSGGAEPGNPFYDITIDGYVLGNLDELTVELHDIYVGSQRNSGKIQLDVRVEVDSESLFGYEEVTTTAGDTFTTPTIITVPVTPERSETGVSEALRFTISDLYESMEMEGEPGEGSSTYHTVRVTVSVPVGAHTIVWGATEIPSGFYTNHGIQGTHVMYGTGFILPS